MSKEINKLLYLSLEDIKNKEIEDKIINIYLDTPNDTIYEIISKNKKNYIKISEDNLPTIKYVFPILKELTFKNSKDIFSDKIELKTGNLILNQTNELNELIGYGSRINKKRGFLFVSKVLGKHIPVRPTTMKSVYEELSNKILKQIDKTKSTIVIGFAETATALGQGVYEEMNLENSFYIHSTRYMLEKEKFFEFYEEHCHAPSHVFYKPQNKEMLDIIKNAENIILIDDEVTTGKTASNLVKELKKVLPKAKNFILSTILDWTEKEFENYKIISIYKDKFKFEKNEKYQSNETYQSIPKIITQLDKEKILTKNFSREGTKKTHIDFTKIINVEKYKNKKVLVLGTAEFMYIPYLMATYLEKQGINVYFQSTTRSPLNIDKDIKTRLIFKDNYFENIDNFLYNVDEGQYDIIIICTETAKTPIEFNLKKQLEDMKFKVEEINYAKI